MGLFDGPGDREGTQGSGGAFSGGVNEYSSSANARGAHNFDRFSSNNNNNDNDDNRPSEPSSQPYTPGVTFRGMGPAGSGITLRTGPGGQIYGVVDKRVSPDGYRSPTYDQAFADKIYRGSDQTNFRGEQLPTPSEQIMQMRQQATLNPRNIFGEEGFSYDYKTTAPGEALPNRTYGDTVMLDGQEVDLVTGYAEPSVGDIVATTLAGMALNAPVGFLDGKETYIAGEEPANLQQQPGVGGLFSRAFTGATPDQLTSAAVKTTQSLRDRFSALSSETPTSTAPEPKPLNMPPSPRASEIDAMAQAAPSTAARMERTFDGEPMNRNAPNYGFEQDLRGGTYDEMPPQARPAPDVTPPISRPKNPVLAQRVQQGIADVLRAQEAKRQFQKDASQEFVSDYLSSITPAYLEARDIVSSFGPTTDDEITAPTFPELRNAPNVGYNRDFGPRSADDLRSMGVEPTLQDLQDMGVSFGEFLRESQRIREEQPVRQANDMSVAQIVPGSAFERATGVNLPRGRSVDLETMQVIRDSDGRIEGDVRALMRNRGMTFQELISLPGLRSSFAPDNTTG